MIVKGHDFPNVTLVGVLAADLSLNQNDYRAGERTFQLLTQAAGRAGRGEKPGEVVIQTYQPEHYSIVHAAAQDYEGFYEEEMAYRELGEYPPAAHLLAVLLIAKEQEEGAALAVKMAELLTEKMKDKKIHIIGPTEASIGKINDLYRQVLYIRQEEYQILVEAKDILEQFCKEEDWKNVTIQYDFDPMTNY